MCWWLTCALMMDASHGRCRVAPLFGAVSTAPHHPTPASILDRVCVLPGLSSGTVSRGRKLPCARSHSSSETLGPRFLASPTCDAESLSPGLHFCASENRGPVSPAPQLERILSSGPVGKGQHSDLPPDMIRLMSKKSDEFRVHFVLKDSSAFSAMSVKPLCPSSTSAHEPTYPCWAG